MATAASPTVVAPGAHQRSDRAPWRETLAPFARPVVARSLLDIATSALPYLALSVGDVSAASTSRICSCSWSPIPAAGFLLRTFIVFHDCAHGSFLPTKRATPGSGRFLGLLVFPPFASWRHSHAVHHATAGRPRPARQGRRPDADRRGVRANATGGRRLGYRLFRNPLVMFGVGVAPVVARSPSRRPRTGAGRRTARCRRRRRAARGGQLDEQVRRCQPIEPAQPADEHQRGRCRCRITLRRRRGRVPSASMQRGPDHHRPDRPDAEHHQRVAEQPVAEPAPAAAAPRYSATVSVGTSPTPRRSRSPEVAWWTACSWRQLLERREDEQAERRPSHALARFDGQERAVRAVVEDDEGAQQEAGGRDREQRATSR